MPRMPCDPRRVDDMMLELFARIEVRATEGSLFGDPNRIKSKITDISTKESDSRNYISERSLGSIDFIKVKTKNKKVFLKFDIFYQIMFLSIK